MVKFTRALAEKSPRAFLEMLSARYPLRAIVAGVDFTFGHRGEGKVETLRTLGGEMGFEVFETPVVLLDGEKVSSTGSAPRCAAAIWRWPPGCWGAE
jgi:riboflavin kinase/FMN adenylyltransferase